MSKNNQLATQGQQTVKQFFAQDIVKQKFYEILGKRSSVFITSVLQIVASNELLSNADPVSIFNAAAVAATLDLPINNNLGFAYIIPYNQRYQDDADGQWKTRVVAQFQLGYKGFKQLALRSGQFLTINATDVREGELKRHDRLTGEMDFVWQQDTATRLKLPVIGFVSYFKLLNGYEQTFYMTLDELKQHGAKYSKNYNNAKSLWKEDEAGMCTKTVIKLNLSRNAPLSVELQTAVKVDQALINDPSGENVSYIDNERPENPVIDKEKEREQLMLANCDTLDDLELLVTSNPDLDVALINKRREELAASKQLEQGGKKK